MKLTRNALVAAALAAIFLGPVSAQAALINGSFELGDPTYTAPPFDTVAPYNSPAETIRFDNLSAGLTDWMRVSPGVGAGNSVVPPAQDNDDHLDYRALLGWTVHGDGIDWNSGDNGGATPGRGAFRADDGNLSVDLNPHAAGGISQTMLAQQIEVGGTYTVSFSLSGNPWAGGTAANDPNALRVLELAIGIGAVTSVSSTAGASTFSGGSVGYFTFVFNTNDPNGDLNTSDALADYSNGSPITDMHWREESLDFAVTQAMATTGVTLLFHSLTTGYTGPVIDNVGVAFNSAVPEPSVLALLAVGAAGGLIARRRRARE